MTFAHVLPKCAFHYHVMTVSNSQSRAGSKQIIYSFHYMDLLMSLLMQKKKKKKERSTKLGTKNSLFFLPNLLSSKRLRGIPNLSVNITSAQHSKLLVRPGSTLILFRVGI